MVVNGVVLVVDWGDSWRKSFWNSVDEKFVIQSIDGNIRSFCDLFGIELCLFVCFPVKI